MFFAGTANTGRYAPRPVIIVAVNGDLDDASVRALSDARERAGVLLIVCGDPQSVNAALGAGV